MLRILACLAVLVGVLVPSTAAADPGRLFITNVVPENETTSFDFRTSPVSIGTQTIMGNGQVGPFEIAPGFIDVTETVPAGWRVVDISCIVAGEEFTGTTTAGSPTITDVELQDGFSTRCRFRNARKVLRVEKTVDADGDGTFSDAETVPRDASFPRVVPYRAVLSNDGDAAATITALDDDRVPAPLESRGAGTDCAALIGTVVAPRSSVTCTYNATFAAAGPAEVVNTLSASVDIAEDGTDSSSDTATVRFLSKLALTKTADALRVPVGSPIGFTMTVVNGGRAPSGATTLTDVLPTSPGLAWTTDTPGCTIAGGTLSCALGTIGPGASRTARVTSTTTSASCGPVANTATAEADGQTVTAAATTEVACSGITLAKSGPAVAHHGDPLPYTFTVANAGGAPLADVKVADDRCTVGATPTSRSDDDGDDVLEAGERWVYTCTATAPAHAAGEANPLRNVATVTAGAASATDDHLTLLVHPAVLIDLTGPETAGFGDTLRYAMAATNPGDVELVGSTVAVRDPACASAPALVSKNGDTTPDAFDPGDTWSYSCTATAPRSSRRPRQTARPTVRNEATITGADPLGLVVTAGDAVVTRLAAPPDEPAPRSRLRGAPKRCVDAGFTVRIEGTRMRRVQIRVDGRPLRAFTAPGRRVRFRVAPGRFGAGLHRLTARVRYDTGGSRRLRLTFERCAPQTVGPRFTG